MTVMGWIGGLGLVGVALGASGSLVMAAARSSPGPRPMIATGPAGDTIPGTRWTRDDWRIFEEKVRWSVEQDLDRAPIGDAIARLGITFVGTTYTPGTLDVPGPERLVINLRELDCVTFVENVVALVRFVRHGGAGLLTDPGAARTRYEAELEGLRYRDGRALGYSSRLHYFSDWLDDNARRGRITLLTRSLGAEPDWEPLDFMSTHAGAYRQLAEPAHLAAIRETETRLNGRLPRWYIPEGRIEAAAEAIRDGDLIAATTTVKGLDIAHTGIALWRKGALHLLHAPLVGKSVEISAVPLGARIRSIPTQDGITVARVTERRDGS